MKAQSIGSLLFRIFPYFSELTNFSIDAVSPASIFFKDFTFSDRKSISEKLGHKKSTVSPGGRINLLHAVAVEDVMETLKLTFHDGSYHVDKPGDQSGEYVKAEVVQEMHDFIDNLATFCEGEPIGIHAKGIINRIEVGK